MAAVGASISSALAASLALYDAEHGGDGESTVDEVDPGLAGDDPTEQDTNPDEADTGLVSEDSLAQAHKTDQADPGLAGEDDSGADDCAIGTAGEETT